MLRRESWAQATTTAERGPRDLVYQRYPRALLLLAAATAALGGCGRQTSSTSNSAYVAAAASHASKTEGTTSAVGPRQGELRLRIRNEIAQPPFETVHVVAVAVDGQEVGFSIGPKVPIQTVATNTVKVEYTPMGLVGRSAVRLIRVGANQAPKAWLHLNIVDGHIVQQLGLPVRVSDLPLRDLSACVGDWAMGSGAERRLFEWSRRVGNTTTQWSLAATVTWDQTVAGSPEVEVTDGRTLEFKLRFLESGRTDREETHSGTFDTFSPMVAGAVTLPPEQRPRAPDAPSRFEGGRGREVVSETTANNTKTALLEPIRTGLTIQPAGDRWHVTYTDQALADYPDVAEPRPSFLDSVTGDAWLSSQVSTTKPWILTTLGEGTAPRLVSVLVDRWTVSHWRNHGN